MILRRIETLEEELAAEGPCSDHGYSIAYAISVLEEILLSEAQPVGILTAVTDQGLFDVRVY